MTMLGIAARVSAVPYESSVDLHAILAAAAERIVADGIGVAGLLQRAGGRLPNGRPSLWVEDIRTGQVLRLDEPRGPGAMACTFDTDALARASTLLRAATESDADVIFVSRFGNVEAEGGGMRGEIADAVWRGKAVLIPVRVALLADLETFLGAPVAVLRPCAAVIADWARGITAAKSAAGV